MKKIMIASRIGGEQFSKGEGYYKFAEIKQLKATLPPEEVIDLGVGEPEEAADRLICRELMEWCGKKEARFYADNGIPGFSRAAAEYMRRVYGVKCGELSLLHGVGSKSILALLPAAFIDPGQWCITTVPGYPIMGTNTQYQGGRVWSLKLEEKNHFLPDLTSIPKEIRENAKLFYINYPNNPTGAVAPPVFFDEILHFCREHNIILVNDCAYGALTRNKPPVSLFSHPLAREWGLETHSLSKAFHMTGWRLGFLLGNKQWVDAYGHVKENSDSGQFIPIQKAGIKAMNNPGLTEKYKLRYFERMDRMEKILKKTGFSFTPSRGTFYIYAKSPRGAGENSFANARECALYLMKQARIITVPWDDAGAYLRFSMTFEAPGGEEKFFTELEKRLLLLNLRF